MAFILKAFKKYLPEFIIKIIRRNYDDNNNKFNELLPIIYELRNKPNLTNEEMIKFKKATRRIERAQLEMYKWQSFNY